MSPHRWLIFVVALASTLVLGVPMQAAPAPLAAPAAPPLVRAATGVLFVPGPAVTLPIQVTNIPQLGAATVLITYDPAVVRPTACQRNAAFNFGLCNTTHDRNGDGTADAVLFNVVSIEGIGAGETAIPLVSITWQAAAGVQPPASTDLGVQVETFTDASANPVAVTTQGGRITIEAGSTPPQKVHLYLPVVGRYSTTP